MNLLVDLILLIEVSGLETCVLLDTCIYFLLCTHPCLITGSTPTHTPSKSTEKDRVSAGRKRRSNDKFKPPDQPPAQKDWVPDTLQHVCMVCQRERFTMVGVEKKCCH